MVVNYIGRELVTTKSYHGLIKNKSSQTNPISFYDRTSELGEKRCSTLTFLIKCVSDYSCEESGETWRRIQWIQRWLDN